MDDTEKRIKSLMKLPNLVNWVRHNKKRLDDTVFQLREFDTNPPKHSLKPVQKLCADIAYGHLTLEEAVEKSEKIKHHLTRAAGREIVPAFHKYINNSGIEGLSQFDTFRSMYIIGKRPDDDPILVPIKPTFIGVKNERLVPVFVIPWAKFQLDNFQRLLLSTIICDSILTQQDFIGSDAEIVPFPRMKYSKTRENRGWKASQYDLLSRDDLSHQFEIYSLALKTVIDEIRNK